MIGFSREMVLAVSSMLDDAITKFVIYFSVCMHRSTHDTKVLLVASIQSACLGWKLLVKYCVYVNHYAQYILGENIVFSILQCSVYLPPCVALQERGNTSRRREMNLVASSMFVVPSSVL